MTQDDSILITGGAGFIGAQLAIRFKSVFPNTRMIALDNLKRRGSELNIPRLGEAGVEFLHGDVRIFDDLPEIKNLRLIIECSAEPSVLAGFDNSPRYVLESNLLGALQCLELARRTSACLIFLSSSRIYPIQALQDLRLLETETRFTLAHPQATPGVSEQGISETFPVIGVRSLYGATKYAAELFIQEYASMYGIHSIINRCGVIAGPWQMGKIDQGFVALWLARHIFGGTLEYIGFGGKGKQVRDVLHVDDLADLILKQSGVVQNYSGEVFNVGGGPFNSISLQELTDLCREVTGKEIRIKPSQEDRPADIPWYVTDNALVSATFDWAPQKSLHDLVCDTARWMTDHQETLRPYLA